MSADFRIKQHLKLSPNAQVKNLVPENLTAVPPEEEWKAGRFWFNTSIGKLQGVFYKLDNKTGLPVEPEELEIRVVGADALGPTKDGEYWPDGLFDFTEQTKISDAMDDVNEALKDLSPPEATLLRGDMNLVDQEFHTGRISRLDDQAPDTVRMVDVTEGDSVDYIIIDESVKATLPTDGLVVKGTQQQQFGKADQGIIGAVINDVLVDEGINLEEVFYEPGRDHFGVMQGFDPEIMQTIVDIEGNESQVEINPNKASYQSSSGSLTINTVERYNDFKKWQRGTGTVDFTVTPGRHTLHVEHDQIISGQHMNAEIVTDPFKTNTLEVFYDPNDVSPTTQITSFGINVGLTKKVSGVAYYNKNIVFSLDFIANDVFTYTYWDKPISMTMPGTTLSTLDWNDSNSNLNGVDVPLWSDTFELSGYAIDYNSPNTITNNITLKTKAGKPATGWGDESTTTNKILIDTYPTSGNSTPIKEVFIDEEYRIKPESVTMDSIASVALNTKNSWDSQIDLVSGEAHQFMGTLIKAQAELSEYGLATDYTSFADEEQVYYRRFYTPDDKPNSNGIIKVKTDGIIGTDFDLFVKLPEHTAWLNTNVLFDSEFFDGHHKVDGTGCSSGVSKKSTGYELPWSIGTLSTADSDYGYLIKVVIKTNDFKIDEIEEISANWR